jgi:exo-beta-1,3-glucanase (GH17 family)
MKNIFRITGIILLIFIIDSCKKDKPTLPTVTTTAVTEISYTTATSGGDATNDGGAPIVSKGVCWNTTSNLTTADSKTTDGTGTGTFTSSITGLTTGSTYYVRAWAKTSVGTSYGNEISFTTNPFKGPIFYNNNGKIINAVCYGPFRDGQAPGSVLTETQIKEDLLIIKNHWDAIRLYISDDNSEKILKVISDNSIDLKVLLGIWISGKTPIDNASQVDRAIALTNTYRNIVQAVSCGNEIFISPESDIYVSNKNEIAGYLIKIHDQTTALVTIDDLYLVWLDPKYSELVSLQDFLAIHIYGQSDNVSLENTVSFIDDKFNELKTLFPQKQILITETGWTTSKNAGQFNPVTVADEVSQKQFYTECQKWSNSNQVPIFYFEAFNERWKGATATEAETNWGFYYANRMPKLVFQGGK